ncbi:unnamed protein product [Arabis nemorensis]|uniref:Uncharacterized protein n=1 Tax=Arabis nemorensis TaxID=586526 RepID=A0A565BJN2_9BRAS|nr:unnamed protein product [Arabis nemorensis]
MGIEAKDVGVLVWKILRFSTSTICRYVKRYPVASGVSAFLIILYTFLPWVFYFMPLIACAVFYLRNHLSSKIGDTSEEEESKTDRGLTSISREGSVLDEGRKEKAELKHQRSVRRNARRKVEEVGKDWDSSQASEDERGKVILTTLYGELLPETISPDLETFKRERTLLVPEESSLESDLGNNGDFVVLDPLERVTSVGGGGENEVECSSEEEEKESGEDRSEVVIAWTEDDQKNLMDLGTSEMERNKRLANLISRRRSRRLFLLAAERSLMDRDVPRICVTRNFYGFDKENYEIDGLLMPGSAPSVLLPRRNPFDLPYDPHEEKPNLTGDSFQQEFAEANPKDIFLCRHESFHHRIFPSESQKDSKFPSLWRKTVDGRPKPLQGSNDQLPLMKEKDLTIGKGDDMEAGEVRIETDSIRNDDSDSNTSLSPREREKDFNVSDQSDASETISRRNDHVGKTLVGLVPRSSGSSSLATARQRYMEHFGYSTRKCHMVSHSVDSDLQVEVSELGSPPTSVDGNDSSDNERSLFIYESETGKEMGFNGGESDMLPVGKVDQDLDNTYSLASPEIEEARKLEHMVPHLDEVFSKRAEELEKLPENTADEIKISYDSDEPEPLERTDQESEEPCERNDGEEMQQLGEAEVSDVNHGDSEEPATSPKSVLPLAQTHSEDLDHTSDGQLQNVDPPAESSNNQLDGSEETFINVESKSAEDHIDPPAGELKNNQTDDGIN